ncbi:hypothetical protein S40288_10798 [Stachybotrys chartarum IBT 40288]|nr:hypothetical protein S40288_10798 [Stachybotrys chartarum IBT 40288]
MLSAPNTLPSQHLLFFSWRRNPDAYITPLPPSHYAVVAAASSLLIPSYRQRTRPSWRLPREVSPSTTTTAAAAETTSRLIHWRQWLRAVPAETKQQQKQQREQEPGAPASQSEAAALTDHEIWGKSRSNQVEAKVTLGRVDPYPGFLIFYFFLAQLPPKAVAVLPPPPPPSSAAALVLSMLLIPLLMSSDSVPSFSFLF